MATDGQKAPRKDELVETLGRRLARLPKADLESLAEGIESGALDLERLAREARGAEKDGPAFGFQRRLQSTKKR